ncbi:histidinol dehydrogenase-domain-containing protein [Jimgerdemannia flammicorona]|uniref:Histidine biosynthesis trifunctional protein n=1 Tax=Jimgerdemannia flammicorona TaxID=994334 RepID=A0A433QJL8_9FUNG|nr:histidinol dehydrogenase-domain-containing protein [Jimgerdemannia flammicorona]
MILPEFDPESTSTADLKPTLDLLADLLISTTHLAVLQHLLEAEESASYWVPLSTDDPNPQSTALALLDAGAHKLVIPLTLLSQNPDAFADLPVDRLAVSTTLTDPQTAHHLDPVLQLVSAYLVTFPATDPADIHANLALNHLVSLGKTSLLPTGGARRVVVRLPNIVSTPDLVAQLDRAGLDLLVNASDLTTAKNEPEKLNLGAAYAASLTSDRPDGLFPTLVVDERDVALGLVYSSVESVTESLRTGQGVYQSRARGLWHKGATSGATQTLIRVAVDCDKDTLKFVVRQHGAGFCHLNTLTCFGHPRGLTALSRTLQGRKQSAPAGSYTARLFSDADLLRSKIMEEAGELCDAKSKEDVAWEAADLVYFALTKCVAAGVSIEDVERNLDRKARKISRRKGDAKPSKQEVAPKKEQDPTPAPIPVASRIQMQHHTHSTLTPAERSKLLLRPIIDSADIISRVSPIMADVRARGDAAVLDFTHKFDRVRLTSPVIRAPFTPEAMRLDLQTQHAIDQAYDNVWRFHDAQMDRTPLVVETMPGVTCTRFARPIERVGLYVPGGTAVLPSSALMLGIPAKVAGCREIVIATPPRPDGTVVPEVMYVAHKVGASCVVVAGGAQAVAAMAYGTESVPKVDKICGPGNQFVTTAKMIAQNDSSCMISIDMPAGPSEVLVIADADSNPAYVASDLLSQAEHGADSQVVLVAVAMPPAHLAAIDDQIHEQASRLPRVEIVRQSIPKSFVLSVETMEEAIRFSNEYAPEHLILHTRDAEKLVEKIDNAGSVFVGEFSPESCGDYASGTNHTLPTYGYSRMYSGVNTHTFLKHITAQQLTPAGLDALGDTVMRLAEVEGLEAHRNAVAIRVRDLRN